MSQQATITHDDIEKASVKFDEARNELLDLRNAYAVQECPFEAGQVVSEGLSEGYDGMPVKVVRVRAPRGVGGKWLLSAVVLREDGSEGDERIEVDSIKYDYAKAKAGDGFVFTERQQQ